MEPVKVAVAALNQTPLDWRGNRARIVEAIAQARRAGAQVLCLPELCISGYGCEDAFHGESVAEQAAASLRLILPETRGMVVAVGLPLIHGQHLFNTAALLADGQVAGFAAKQVLAGYGVYYEPRWFKAWPAGEVREHPWEGTRVPIGDLLFDVGGVRLRFEICEDAWGRGHSRAGGSGGQADLLLNPSASHFAFDKYATLRGIVTEGSRLSHAVYLYSNLVGNEAGRLIFDGAGIIASDGHIVAENPRFSFREVGVTTAVVDLRANRLQRRRLSNPVTLAKAPEAGLVHVPLALTAAEGEPTPSLPNGTTPEPHRHEQFARAVSLGLWDYLRKSRTQGFALSISGGVDSGSVAVLVWMMARLALAELGPAGVAAALEHVAGLPGGDGAAGARELVRRLLLTAYQGTPNSSPETRAAAAGLAEQVGARHVELDVGPLVAAYEGLAEGVLGRPLTWAADDLARQNIQARVRSPGIWLLANLEGRLLVSTSNRSEVGAGYATMDGDTSGGLAPIAGANKSFLREWLRWVEAEGLPGLGPLSKLAAVNRQAPTAELRPLSEGQQDERDLMPYVVLDAIEQAAIRDRMSPVQVWRRLRTRAFPGLTLAPRELADHVTRFFQLWSRTQWKRERLAPSFHLDDENLDPRTWCRFPILSGGYEVELEELARAVAAELEG